MKSYAGLNKIELFLLYMNFGPKLCAFIIGSLGRQKAFHELPVPISTFVDSRKFQRFPIMFFCCLISIVSLNVNIRQINCLCQINIQ